MPLWIYYSIIKQIPTADWISYYIFPYKVILLFTYVITTYYNTSNIITYAASQYNDK